MNDDDKKIQKDDEGNLINVKTKKKIDADGNEPDDEVPRKASDKAVNSPTDVITNALYGILEENEAKAEAAARAAAKAAAKAERGENAAAGKRPTLEPISKTCTPGRIGGGKPSDTSDAAPPSSSPWTPFSTNPFKKKPEPH